MHDIAQDTVCCYHEKCILEKHIHAEVCRDTFCWHYRTTKCKKLTMINHFLHCFFTFSVVPNPYVCNSFGNMQQPRPQAHACLDLDYIGKWYHDSDFYHITTSNPIGSTQLTTCVLTKLARPSYDKTSMFPYPVGIWYEQWNYGQWDLWCERMVLKAHQRMMLKAHQRMMLKAHQCMMLKAHHFGRARIARINPAPSVASIFSVTPTTVYY